MSDSVEASLPRLLMPQYNGSRRKKGEGERGGEGGKREEVGRASQGWCGVSATSRLRIAEHHRFLHFLTQGKRKKKREGEKRREAVAGRRQLTSFGLLRKRSARRFDLRRMVSEKNIGGEKKKKKRERSGRSPCRACDRLSSITIIDVVQRCPPLSKGKKE